MKTQAEQFNRDGFVHRQIKREGMIALFERFKPGPTQHHFEVVRLRVRRERQIGGSTVPGGECYPSSSQWGNDGFTYNDRAGAEDRFMALVEREAEKVG